jgi:DnaA family protein
MSKAIEMSSEIFQNLSSLDSVCIDDLHLILSKKDWEVATFNLINECNQTGCNIFFSYGGGRELDEMIMLPDLLSRLKRMEFMTLHAVKDELLDSAINFICTQLDINLDKPELEFLMKRHKRELSSILSDLILLDQNAASLKRKITIPFIKETLDL